MGKGSGPFAGSHFAENVENPLRTITFARVVVSFKDTKIMERFTEEDYSEGHAFLSVLESFSRESFS
jgi:hypothetical protein